MTNSPFPLTSSKPGEKVRILKFDNSLQTFEKLQQYGLFAGDTAQIVRIAPFDGPILLSVKGREIALGESIAAHILVERVA